MARVLEDDRQRVPAGPDLAAGAEAAARAGREVLLRRGRAAAARLRRARRPSKRSAAAVRGPGDIVLVSCYEPGHQPQGVASAIAFLRARRLPADLRSTWRSSRSTTPRGRAWRRRGSWRSRCRCTRRWCSAAASPRTCGARTRGAHLCFFGLYATLNRALLAGEADSVLGPDCEPQLVALARVARRPAPPPSVGAAPARPPPVAGARSRRAARRSRSTRASRSPASSASPATSRRRAAASTSAATARSRPSTRAASSPCRPTSCSTDARAQIAAGARHIDFGDPDFLNGPKHALRIARGAARRAPGRHLQLHRQGRAHRRARARSSPSWPRRVRCSSSAPSSRCPIACSARSTRATARRRAARARDRARAPASRCGRRSSRSRRGRRSTTTWSSAGSSAPTSSRTRSIPSSSRSACWSRPGSLLLAAPDIAPFLGPLDAEALSYRWTHPDPRMDRLEAEVVGAGRGGDAQRRRAAGGHLRAHPPPGRDGRGRCPTRRRARAGIGLRPRRPRRRTSPSRGSAARSRRAASSTRSRCARAIARIARATATGRGS